jgi:uncharacterized protein (TIGR02147 family)
MTGNSVFDFRDYKAYLRAYIGRLPARGHGFRAQISKSLGVHSAYVTQVLSGNAHFSLEQAEELNSLLNHNEQESEFFLLLLQLARAGTLKLKRRTQTLIDQVLRSRTNLRDRVKIQKELSSEDQLIYYSSWHYTAVHIILTIPKFQYVEKIAEALKLPKEKVKKILDYLISVGLVEQAGAKYLPSTTQIYLGRDAAGISKHHTNWRMKAIESLDQETTENLHFSAAISLSKEDYEKIRDNLAEKVQEAMSKVKNSKEEMLSVMNIDFFRLTE